MSIADLHALAASNFMDAFFKEKKHRLEKQFHEPKSEVVQDVSNVLLQCPNCAAPNSGYKINCEYCSSPLRK